MFDMEFWITLFTILLVNLAFLLVNILFMILVSAILWYYQRKMSKELNKAIKTTQKMLKRKSTYMPIMDALFERTEKSFGSIINAAGSKTEKILIESGVPVNQAKGLGKIIKNFGGTKRTRAMMEAAGDFVDQQMAKGKENPKTKEVNERPPEGSPPPEALVEQQKKMQELQDFADSVISKSAKKKIEAKQKELGFA